MKSENNINRPSIMIWSIDFLYDPQDHRESVSDRIRSQSNLVHYLGFYVVVISDLVKIITSVLCRHTDMIVVTGPKPRNAECFSVDWHRQLRQKCLRTGPARRNQILVRPSNPNDTPKVAPKVRIRE